MITPEQAREISDRNSSEEVKTAKRIARELADVNDQIMRSASVGSKKAFIKKLYHEQTKEKLKELGYSLSVCSPCFETVISWE